MTLKITENITIPRNPLTTELAETDNSCEHYNNFENKVQGTGCDVHVLTYGPAP
jgi:hypothetical protein